MAKRAYIGINNIARKIKRGYIGIGGSTDSITVVNLPSGYTQLPYIQSTGTQYIDTGVIPDRNTRIVLDVEGFGTKTEYLYGVDEYKKDFCLVKTSATSSKVYGYYFGGSASITVSNTTDRLIYEQNGSAFSIGTATANATASSSYTECSYPIHLFNIYMHDAGGITKYGASVKLYSCQIYDNGTLVRDYVPCTNASGVVGLYDIVNSAFYTTPVDTFTAGVLTGSVARKIKKAYIGIGGVARPCWGGGTFTYYGAITPLTTSSVNYAATSNGSYAVFMNNSGKSAEAYDRSLSLHTAPNNDTYSSGGTGTGLAATSVGNYAVFGGGSRYSSSLKTIHAYDRSLTYTSNSGISKYLLAAATVGDYALFGGGYHTSSGTLKTMLALDASLTKTTPTSLSVVRKNLAASSNGSYALFGGGSDGSDVASAVVDAYDASKTRSTPTELSVARYNLAATHVGKYVLFAGGYTGSSFTTTVEAYDKSLTRTIPTVLSAARDQLAATHIDGYALFGGGRTSTGGSTSKVVDVYNELLTRTIPTALTTAAYGLCATSVNDFALFPVRNASTDAYTIV